MGIERIGPKEILDYNAICPDCRGRTVFIHDLKCDICDNKTIVWCPKCKYHFKVTF